MTEIGTVLEGKYEIVKEIGRGGMSVVYLAMDMRLRKNWAVKEIKKQGRDKNDEIAVNSLLTEANLMKRFNHPALPRIVDIIDNGTTIYVVMDYIEGQSLDVVLKEFGVQSEEDVIKWAKQICDALSYLHSQKPPVIYRDMKPSNLMLDDGNIKIIDFGIAREYKEENLADTKVLGTKGFASPEAYNGQTDARSDIFSLGMTMHNLLTGVYPQGNAYAPVRNYVPELSEGIELIIDKCVEPAAENRYQSCADLLYDLSHPDLITKGFKKKQKIKLISFIVAAAMSLVMAITGVALNLSASNLNKQDYEVNISTSNPENYYNAIGIYPERIEAYNLLIEYYKNHDATEENVKKIGNTIETNSSVLDTAIPEFADLYYDMGKLYFSEFSDNSLKNAAVNAKPFFETAVNAQASFDKKEIAECYLSICNFMTKQSKTSENSLDDYNNLFNEIKSAIDIIDTATDSEANYDKISLYYVTMLLINDQADLMASVGFERETALDWMETLYNRSNSITSTLTYVNDSKEKVQSSYNSFVANINAKYNEVEKRQQGGN